MLLFNGKFLFFLNRFRTQLFLHIIYSPVVQWRFFLSRNRFIKGNPLKQNQYTFWGWQLYTTGKKKEIVHGTQIVVNLCVISHNYGIPGGTIVIQDPRTLTESVPCGGDQAIPMNRFIDRGGCRDNAARRKDDKRT